MKSIKILLLLSFLVTSQKAFSQFGYMHGLGGGVTFDYLSTPSFTRLNYTPEVWYHARLNVFDNGNFFGLSFDAIPGLGGSYSSKYGGYFQLNLPITLNLNFGAGSFKYSYQKAGFFAGVGFNYVFSVYDIVAHYYGPHIHLGPRFTIKGGEKMMSIRLTYTADIHYNAHLFGLGIIYPLGK